MATNDGSDITLLKVKGEGSFIDDQTRKDYVKSLASAITTVINKHGKRKSEDSGAHRRSTMQAKLLSLQEAKLQKGC
jgi:hypothetical protein